MDIPLETWKTYVNLTKDIFTVLAIIFGGIWTYIYFLKGKDFEQRLNIIIKGCWVKAGKDNHLVLNVVLENRGKVRVTFKGDPPSLVIYGYKKKQSKHTVNEVKPANLGVFSIFEPRSWEMEKGRKSFWVESNESLVGTKVIDFYGDDFSVIQVELIVFSGKHRWDSSAFFVEPGVAIISRGESL
tara:strand:- start:300 stop:854 length:555 start_codon:yes stop_codon:yes gene_type:complete